MDTSNSQKSDRAVWRCRTRAWSRTHPGGVGGGRGGHKPAAAARVCLRPEAGRTHTESIFLMPSISFMRMDYAAGIIYTSGDDKF